MPSELPEFNDWVEYQKKTTGNKVDYPSSGFLPKADLPKLPAINQQWKDEEQSAVLNTNGRTQRDVVISFSLYHNGIKAKVFNRLKAMQLARKRAAVIVMDNGIIDRLRDTVNETVGDTGA
jgi:hypothetical protein